MLVCCYIMREIFGDSEKSILSNLSDSCFIELSMYTILIQL